MGAGQYYLGIYTESNDAIKKFSHLFFLLLGRSPSFYLINILSKFCKKIAYDDAIKVADKMNYIMPKYDQLIGKALKNLVKY